ARADRRRSDLLGRGPLRVGGVAVDPAQDEPSGPAPRPRSAPARGGGFDRVGGSRLTPVGALLVLAVIIGAASPPTSTDHQVVAIIWAALVGVFALGIAVPLLLVRRVRVEVASPRDATVGEEVPVDVRLSGRVVGLEVRALDPTGSWHRATSPGHGKVLHLADHRGLFQVLRVEVRVTAPFGVLAAHRVHTIALPFAVEVAPRALAVSWFPAPAPVAGGSGHHAVVTQPGDLVRSVRPYVSGDPAHLVHWPSSARLGELVVRELEPPAPVGQAVVLDLRDLGTETERAASYASGACRAVLAAGGDLVLCTSEASGPVAGRVRTVLDAGRRLARAVPGPPAVPPEGWPVVEIGS
ncbi:MAG: hypothetical protein JWM47_2836, partial [Acidimicrobiales bacterium]|nr:hypothetical protein [Acidimicrobiales bacterium]